MENIKIIDGFIYAIINQEQARQKFKSCDCVYILYDDGTESLIEDENELQDAITNKRCIGIEIGLKSVLLSEYEEGEQNRFRNNDETTFNEWLETKLI
jgi:hypothetical protein